LVVGETVDVIHYGYLASDINGTPLQFSLVDNFTVFEKRNMGEIIALIHTAHTAPGSSGGPNFSTQGKVVGIQFAGSDGKAISLHIENGLRFIAESTNIFNLVIEYQKQQALMKDAKTEEEKDNIKQQIQTIVSSLKSVRVGYLGIAIAFPNRTVIPSFGALDRLLKAKASDIWLGQTKQKSLQTATVSIYASKDTSKPLLTQCELCISEGWATVECFTKSAKPNLTDKTTYFFGNPKELYSGVLFKVSNLPQGTRYFFQDVRKL